VLAVLSVLLRKAVEWEVIEQMPCSIKLLRVVKSPPRFRTGVVGRRSRQSAALRAAVRLERHGNSTKERSSQLVPLTRRLAAALSAHRHRQSSGVLCQDNSEPLTR
jgi:hypothetical protein